MLVVLVSLFSIVVLMLFRLNVNLKNRFDIILILLGISFCVYMRMVENVEVSISLMIIVSMVV